MRLDHFVHEARFAHAGLAEQRDHLPVPGARPFQGLVQRLQLRLPAHKGREPPGDGGLQAPAHGRGPDQLKDVYGLLQALNGHRAERGDLHKAFHQPQDVPA